MRRPKYSSALPSPARPATAARRRRHWPALLLLVLSAGCHAYVPSFGGRPQAGTRVSLAISDQGRVALTDQVSPGVLRIEGTLVGVEDDQYLLNVYEVKTIDGRNAHWAGERVAVRQDHVVAVYERRFSKGRTVAAVVAATVGLGVVALASKLIGGASAGREGGGGGGGSEQ